MSSFLSAYNIMDNQESTMSFQKIVLIIAVVMLVLTLSLIGYMMYYSSKSQPYPPKYSACPDMWGLTGTNTCINNTAIDNGYFSNVGTFITDVSCSIAGPANLCSEFPNWNDLSFNWVQGNSANGLDPSNNYLLANAVGLTTNNMAYSSPTTVSHNLVSSLSDNVSWARTYGITWDGLN